MARGLYSWTRWEIGECRRGLEISRGQIDIEPTTAQWRSDASRCYYYG